MKENLTEIVFILDKSGSMGGLEADTLGGYNSFLEKQKKIEGKAFVSTILFNTSVSIIHDRVALAEVEPLTEAQYSVGGGTALLDALGETITHIKKMHMQLEEDSVPSKTIFVIITDGEENSSNEYSYSQVKKLIEKQQEQYHWEFLFLGANIDVIAEASKLGIAEKNAVRYTCDKKGTNLNFDSVGIAMCCIRKNREMPDEWAKEIREYCEKNKEKK